jgi:hypothetical protein
LILNDSEKSLLAALVQSPAFKVLEKIVENDVTQSKNLLVHADDIQAIHRLQGRIVGAQLIKSIPNLLAHQHNKQKVAAEKKKSAEFKKPNP